MKYRMIELEKALNPDFLMERGYKWIWYQQFTRTKTAPVAVIPVSDCGRISLDMLIEACIFERDAQAPSEIHIFDDGDGQHRAVEILSEAEDNEAENYTDRRQLLKKQFGKYMTIRYYFNQDEDGQAGIECAVIRDYEA